MNNKPIILFWLKEFPKVSETFIRDQLIGLIDQGAQVLIYTEDKKGGKALEAIADYASYNLMERVTSPGTLMPKNLFLRIIKAKWLLFRALFSKNTTYYWRSINMLKYRSQARNLKLLFLVDFVLKNQVEVVHAHFGPVGNQAVVLKELGLPLKLFTTFHGYDIRYGIEHIEANPYKRLFNLATGIFAISDFNKNSLLRMGLNANKIIPLPNGINTAFYNCPKKPNTSTLRFLSVGRLVPEKDYANAFKALAQLKLKQPDLDWEYLIIGDGELKLELQELAKALKLDTHLYFKGAQPTSAVQEAYCKADLFLLPSKSEALPTVLLEAQASGLPCVATQVGAVPNMLGERGFLADPENPDALFKAISKALTNKGEWESIGKQGRALVIANHDSNTLIKELIRYYKEF